MKSASQKNITLSFLADFCSRHSLDEKILIVPTYQTGGQIGEALTKAGNVFKMLEVLKDQETRGYHSFSDLVEFMEEITSLRDLEEISLTPGKKNAVRLMNLHKVKGLKPRSFFSPIPKE